VELTFNDPDWTVGIKLGARDHGCCRAAREATANSPRPRRAAAGHPASEICIPFLRNLLRFVGRHLDQWETGTPAGFTFSGPHGKSAGSRRYPAEMTLPAIQPIAATWRKEPFDHPEWLFEVKYDGFRALCFVENGRCSFVSRRGNVFTRFDALCEQVASALCHEVVSELGVDDAIVDGEVIATDESGRPQFYDLLRRTRSPSYIAFDLLWLNGTDLRALPLRERRRRLEMMLPTGSRTISEAVSVEGRGRELFDMMCAHDLEGIVAKRLADPYEPRVRWLKIKNSDYSQKERRGDLFNTPPRRRNFG
jgi:ATP-dependent DNA ligase